MPIFRVSFLISGLLLVQNVFGQSGPSARPQQRRGIPPAPDQASVERGQKFFSQNCGFCHGKDANGGDGGPDLIRSVLVNHDENGNLVGPMILSGRPDKGMPPFKVTPEQISDIANFLHARVRSIRYRQLYQVKGVEGDAKAGEAFFTQTGRCNTCHSTTGDLNHIASKYDPETLLRRMLYPSSRGPGRSGENSRTKVTVTVTMPSGESFSGPLVQMDEFTVSMYDDSGNYHTWNREGLKVDVHDPLAAHVDLLQHYTDDQMHNVAAYLETLK
jgi:cytochrome c oxidase cbb3-type subunit 3